MTDPCPALPRNARKKRYESLVFEGFAALI
jgi:hypothetical protein